MDKATDMLLQERAKTHGDFRQVAEVAQVLKDAVRHVRMMRTATADDTTQLHPTLQEAIDMIASKLGRIAAGDEWEIDHWNDIAGYAQLAARAVADRAGPVDRTRILRAE